MDLNADPARGLVASLPQSGSWLMVWLGYYLAGCAVFLALRSERFLAGQDRRGAPTPAIASDGAADALCVERHGERVRITIERIEWVAADGDNIRGHTAEEEGGGKLERKDAV